MGFPFWYFAQELSHFFINSGGSIQILTKLFEIYVFILPMQLFLGVIYSICRALGKQGVYIIAQVLCEYVFHFTALWILMEYVSAAPVVFVGNLGLTYIAMIICGSMIIFGSNWKEESRKLRKDMKVEIESKMQNKSRITTDL